jgi:hypothetical protein
VQEAELAGTFGATKIEIVERKIATAEYCRDYFTKTLPINRQIYFSPYIGVDDPATALPKRLDLPIVI